MTFAVLNWQDRILVLPEPDIWTLIGSVLFVLFLIFIYVFGYNYIRKKTVKNTRWNILLQYMLRHDLSTKDINVIKEIYTSLTPDVQEELITSKKYFHKLLTESLLEQSTLDAEDRVTIMEKLFPPSEHISEVKSMADIAIGEVCALESADNKLVGTVVKKSTNEIMISMENLDPLGFEKNSEVSLYLFRPRIGGFLLQGLLRQVGPDFMIFQYNGQVEQKSGHHLMAYINISVLFTPWPQPSENSKEFTHQITAQSVLFSDRAMVFTAKNMEDVPYYLNHHDMWVLQTKLPDGYVFKCRGLIKPSQRYDHAYIFRYLDASEIARNVLYAIIKNHSPQKEVIS